MNKDYLKNISKEERAMMLKKAQAKRDQKRKAGEILRQNYLDESYHRQLASEYGLRMPAAYISNKEVRYLKRVAKHFGIELKDYLEDCGVETLKQLVAINPQMSAVEEIGIFLEWVKEMK